MTFITQMASPKKPKQNKSSGVRKMRGSEFRDSWEHDLETQN